MGVLDRNYHTHLPPFLQKIMTIKRAIAIGLLTTTTIALTTIAIFNHKQKTEQTKADTISEEILYETNFNSEIPTQYNKITFTGNAQYVKQITNLNTQYVYRYNFTQIQAVNNTNSNNWAKITPITNQNYIVVESQPYQDIYNKIDFTWLSTSAYDMEDYFTFRFKQIIPDNNQTISKNFEIGVNISDLTWNNTSNSLAQAFGQFNGTNLNENENLIVNESNIGNQTEYQLGYDNGYQDGYNQAIEEITPNTISTNYVISTLQYNETLSQTYYTALGNFNTINPKPFSNNNNYVFSGTINITVTNKTYIDTNYNNINGYQLELTADFERIYNETTDTELLQQNHTTSKALIYTETQPNGITVNITNLTTTNIVMSATVSNENYLYVNQNFYTTYSGQTLTESNTTPLTPLPLCSYNIANNINQVTSILQTSVDNAFIEGVNTGQQTGEVIPLADTMLEILTMPFTFISQAFNVTLWPGTQYAFNFSNFIKGLLAISAVLFIIKVFTSGFAVFGQYNSHRNSNMKSNKPQKQKTSKPTTTKE